MDEDSVYFAGGRNEGEAHGRAAGGDLASPDAIIRFEHVDKSFGELRVLSDITCGIERGKTTVFIGPSGVGKTVLLKHIVGLHQPDRGGVFVEGENVAYLTERELYGLRRKVGMLFQSSALFDSMTVGENVAFPLIHHTKMREGEIRKVVAQKLALVGLPGIESKYPAELSGGMRKRVGLARAIALEPEIVLFDEPTTGLDPVTAAAIDELMVDMHDALGSTFVVISHDIDTTRRIAHTVGMLYQTRLIAYGPSDEIMDSEDPILRQFFSRSARGPMMLA
jgi:phospholipid/cholesterol/gamma-HCH transport system ATP-binding protein